MRPVITWQYDSGRSAISSAMQVLPDCIPGCSIIVVKKREREKKEENMVLSELGK